MSWTYNGGALPDNIEDYYGFVYIITNTVTGRKYIGRKYFTKAGYKTVKGKRKKIRVSSDWMTYYGSNRVLQEDVARLGPDSFSRNIIQLCNSKSECSYWETFYIFSNEALLSDAWYNDWVTCKISKSHLKSLAKSLESCKIAGVA